LKLKTSALNKTGGGFPNETMKYVPVHTTYILHGHTNVARLFLASTQMALIMQSVNLWAELSGSVDK
jgi:hypothetical protein